MSSDRPGRKPSRATERSGSENGAHPSFVAAPGFGSSLDAAGLFTRVSRISAAALLDLRDLPAPEPMERILEACARLGPGGAIAAQTPRLPRMLLPILEKKGLLWAAVEQPDGSGLVYVERPTND